MGQLRAGGGPAGPGSARRSPRNRRLVPGVRRCRRRPVSAVRGDGPLRPDREAGRRLGGGGGRRTAGRRIRTAGDSGAGLDRPASGHLEPGWRPGRALSPPSAAGPSAAEAKSGRGRWVAGARPAFSGRLISRGPACSPDDIRLTDFQTRRSGISILFRAGKRCVSMGWIAPKKGQVRVKESQRPYRVTLPVTWLSSCPDSVPVRFVSPAESVPSPFL